MAISQRKRQESIEAILAEHRKHLEARLTDDIVTLDQIEAVVEESSRDQNKPLEGILIEYRQPEQTNKSACPKCSRLCNYKGNIDIMITTIHAVQKIRRRNH